jgi:hypothetical protein
MSRQRKRCQAIKADGTQCKNLAIDGEIYCHAHHPDRKQDRIENGRKGGKVTRRPELPECKELTVQQSRQLLAACAEKLIQGKLSSNVARSLAYLLQTDKMLKEHDEIIARLAKLEGKKAKSEDIPEAGTLEIHGL